MSKREKLEKALKESLIKEDINGNKIVEVLLLQLKKKYPEEYEECDMEKWTNVMYSCEVRIEENKSSFCSTKKVSSKDVMFEVEYKGEDWKVNAVTFL